MANKQKIKVKAPLRVSFAGGGTDLNEVFEKYKGKVINTTINKFVYVELKEGKGVKLNGKCPDKFTLNILNKFKVNNIHIKNYFDIPYARGLGSSSAYSVALSKAICLYKNSHLTKKQIVNKVYHIENSLGKCGWQDQIACCYGGLNYITFNNKGYNISKVKINNDTKKKLENSLILVYSGLTHNSKNIQKKKPKLTKQKIDKILSLVDKTYKSLKKENIDNIPEILNKGWQLKKNKVITNKKIDKIYYEGFRHGAIGGKLLGAGDGGYILFYVEPQYLSSFKRIMSKKYELLTIKLEKKGVTICK